MPYIKHRRDFLEVHPREAENAGELNFALTSIIGSYIHSKGPSYATFNEVIGVLECAKQELYRRVIGKYEDQKIRENGDVFPDWMVGKVGRSAMQDANDMAVIVGVPPHVKLPEAEVVRLHEAVNRHPENIQEFTEAEMYDLKSALRGRETRAME